MSEKLVVLAKNRAEMMEAQTQSVGWAFNKVQHARAVLAEAETNLNIAAENMWNTSGWKKTLKREKKRVQYYEKIHAALEAGYVIIPNFPIDVFAVRTQRNYPLKHYSTSWSQDRDHKSEALALGEGDHVDSVTHQSMQTYPPGTFGESQKYDRNYYWADDFKDVDFPIKGVKPAILEETSKALLLKIFDEVGCTPGRNIRQQETRFNLKADPMVVGRILFKDGGKEKAVSFLVTWWLDFDDITV